MAGMCPAEILFANIIDGGVVTAQIRRSAHLNGKHRLRTHSQPIRAPNNRSGCLPEDNEGRPIYARTADLARQAAGNADHRE